MRKKKKLKPDSGGGRCRGCPPSSWPVLNKFFNFLLVPEPVFLGRSDFLAGQKVRPSGFNIFRRSPLQPKFLTGLKNRLRHEKEKEIET
jgi:hypothetical protein